MDPRVRRQDGSGEFPWSPGPPACPVECVPPPESVSPIRSTLPIRCWYLVRQSSSRMATSTTVLLLRTLRSNTGHAGDWTSHIPSGNLVNTTKTHTVGSNGRSIAAKYSRTATRSYYTSSRLLGHPKKSASSATLQGMYNCVSDHILGVWPM